MPRTEGHYIKKGGFSVKSNAFFDRLTVAAAALLLASFSLSLCLLPKQDFSSKERRALAAFPVPSLSSLLDGRFFDGLSNFCADQFPLRPRFTALVSTVERAFGKQENNGILFGADGYLIARGEYDDLTVAQSNLAAIDTLAKNTQCPITIAILPRAVDVLTPYLPRTYEGTRADKLGTLVCEQLPSNTDLTADLRAAAEAGEAIFYRTDHHWTSAGAYLGYTQLAPSLGIEVYAPEHFTPTPVCDTFLGTSFARSGLWSTTPDAITLYRYKGDENYTVTCDGKIATFGLYDMDAVSGDDPYAVFLGGNYARVTVTGEAARETLLIFKDSFANSLVPFLALHFDLVLVDPRYETRGAQAILDEISPDRVLILLGADTVATTPAVGRIGR